MKLRIFYVFKYLYTSRRNLFKIKLKIVLVLLYINISLLYDDAYFKKINTFDINL
jgi:hypothetical protein